MGGNSLDSFLICCPVTPGTVSGLGRGCHFGCSSDSGNMNQYRTVWLKNHAFLSWEVPERLSGPILSFIHKEKPREGE